MCTCIYIYAIAIQTGSFAIWNRPFPNRSCAGSIFFPDAMPRWRMSDSEDVSDEAMGGLEDDESSSEESLSNFFCEDWVPKQKLPCLFCFKNNVNFPLVSHNRPTMPSQELSAEQQSFLEFGQDFSLMGGRLEIKIGQPCEHLVVVCVCVADSTCLQHRQFPLLIQALPNSGATSKGISPMHPTVTWINTSKNFQDTAVTDIPMWYATDLPGFDFERFWDRHAANGFAYACSRFTKEPACEIYAPRS